MSKKNTQVSHNLHGSFISELTRTSRGTSFKRYRKHYFNKITGVDVKPGINLPTVVKEVFLEPSIKIHPEAFAFLFFSGGCSKNLLLFILIQKHDSRTGFYSFNASVVDEFQEFCKNHFGEKYTESTVKQAHRDLVSSNITLNIKTGSYFLNPLLSGGINTSGRRKLINEYTKLLLKKRKDPAFDIYPTYNKTSALNKVKPVWKYIDLK
jgi:hypothetical protein